MIEANSRKNEFSVIIIYINKRNIKGVAERHL